jgi:colicin import membrane protein
MSDNATKITPLDPVYHGESNYEVGLEDLLAQTKEKLKKMRSDPTVTKEQLRLVEEDLQTLETLWENYHIGMNVFRNAKGGHDGLREVKTD